MPRFAHLPLLLKPEGNGKLSKRDGDRLGFPVFPLEWTAPDGTVSAGYRESGYLSEAVVNFLALLGWNPGDDTEMMTIDELVSKFDLERCSKSGAKFDYEKGKWFNHKYIQEISLHRLSDLCMPYCAKAGWVMSQERLEEALSLIRDRITLLPDVVEQVGFLFEAPTSYDEKTVQKRWKADTPVQIESACQMLGSLGDFSSEHIDAKLKDWIEANGYGMGAVMNALRLALVGAPKGPHINDIIAFLGKDETLARLQRSIATIQIP